MTQKESKTAKELERLALEIVRRRPWACFTVLERCLPKRRTKSSATSWNRLAPPFPRANASQKLRNLYKNCDPSRK
jgi:hypothetical protein